RRDSRSVFLVSGLPSSNRRDRRALLRTLTPGRVFHDRLYNLVDAVGDPFGRKVGVVRQDGEGDRFSAVGSRVTGKCLYSSERSGFTVNTFLQTRGVEAVRKRSVNSGHGKARPICAAPRLG